MSDSNPTTNPSTQKHLAYGDMSSEYNSWRGMKTRCNYKSATGYENYGGRGITYDPRWEDFDEFLKDMGPKPDPTYSIDRIDNDKGYGPDNCRWADRKTQANNTRLTVKLTYNGETLTLSQWADKLGVTRDLLKSRRLRGWSDEEIITGDKKENTVTFHYLTYKGETLRMHEWAKKLGMPYGRLRDRKKWGWTDEEAIEGVRKNHKHKKRKNAIMIHYKGEDRPLKDVADELGLSYNTLRARKSYGWEDDEIISGIRKGSTLVMTYKGETKTMKEWAKKFNASYRAIHKHRAAGISDDVILRQAESNFLKESQGK